MGSQEYNISLPARSIREGGQTKGEGGSKKERFFKKKETYVREKKSQSNSTSIKLQ